MRAAALLPIALLALHPALARSAEPEPVESGCLACHRGIEPIREAGSPMMQQILALGRERGDPAGCVVCHGGDASATTAEIAHGGGALWPDPGSPWVNEHTCGRCHPRHVAAQWNSLMMTEAGKIQGVAWAFGLPEDYVHRWGNYDAHNPADPGQRLGTEAYRAYMERLGRKEPGVFPDSLLTVPEAPADPGVLAEHPELAAFTYIRTECQRCHLAVRGRAERGDWRGMGCSACHLPYGNEGLYEGGDESIPKDRPGHALVHSIQATREASVSAHGATWSGIPVETCTTCQVSVTVVGEGGEALVANRIFRTPPGSEGSGPQGQLSLDMSPVQPHTMGRARTCESCHLSEKALGHGIAGGRLHRPWDQALTVDLMTAAGEILPRSARTQIEAIPGLEADWSRFVTEDGRQLQTVGHHFSGSRPLDCRERASMDRQGLCLSCHLHHVADAAGALPTDREAHHGLVHKILLMSAWGQVGGMVLMPLVGLAGIAWLIRRRRRRRVV